MGHADRTSEGGAVCASEGERGQAGGRWLLSAWLAGIAALYALTLRPSIAWNDGPEFVDVAYTLGIPHPPGSPTYALLGKIATLIPLGGIAARVNLLSAACALGAIAILARCIFRVHIRLGGSPSAGRLGGLLAATLLAVAPTWWSYATQAEVYAPFALVVALLLYLALRWDESLDERYLLAGTFLFGLSGGVHGTAIFFTPALAILVLTRMPRERAAGALLRAALLGCLGASVYLYLPIRAVSEPAFNWGHPDTWARFWAHVSDRKDDSKHFQPFSLPWWPFVKIFARNLNTEVTPLGWVGASAGLAILLVRARRLALFTTAFCLGNLLFFLRIWTIPDAYLPTFLLVAFWAGLFLAWVLHQRTRGGGRVAGVAVCVTTLVAVTAQTREGCLRSRQHQNDAARSVATSNLLPLPPNSVALVTAQWFPMRYLQDVEGMRPDVSILLVSDLTAPQVFTPVTPERFPGVAVPARDRRGERWDRFFQGLLRENLGRVPVYWEPISELSRNVHPYLRPWRYLWKFDPTGARAISRADVDAYFADLRNYLEAELRSPAVLDDPDAIRFHAYLLSVSAELLKLQGRPQDALILSELAARLTPNSATVANELGRLYSGFGRWKDAERMFIRAAALTPADATALLNVAILQMSMGRLAEARRTIERAIATNPGAPEAYYQLSVLERKAGKRDAARGALKQALARTDDTRYVRAWLSELQMLQGTATP